MQKKQRGFDLRGFDLPSLALAISAAALLLPALAEAKGDAAKGKTKAAVCAACHGPAGISPTPIWPNLAGQKEQYLIKQLKDFKAGKRKEPTMAPMVAALSDQDIEDLAAYFSGLKCAP